MMPSFAEIWAYLTISPILWVTVTLLAYQAAYAIYRLSGANPIANPILISVMFIVSLLLFTGTPYRTYLDGAELVNFLIGPAIVAMAVPLYAHLARMKTMLVPLTVALLIGSLTAISSAVAIGWLSGGSNEILLALAPKSATMPIAMGIVEKLGGFSSLTSVTVTVTGIAGAIMSRGLLNLMRIDDDAIHGFALGITAHGIGTARALQMSESAGAFAALGMVLNGVATSVLLPLIVHLSV